MEPEDKVIFLVYDMDTDEYEELEMDKEAYDALCRAEEEHEKKMEEIREREHQETNEAMRYAWEHERRLEEEYAERMTRRLEDDDEW